MSRVQGTAEEEPLGSRSSVPRCERDSPPSPGPAGNWRHRPRRTYDLGPCSQEPLESRERNGGSCGTCAEPTCSPRRSRRPAPPAAVHYGTSSSPAASAASPKGRTPCVAAARHVGSCRLRVACREPCREHFTFGACHALPRRFMHFGGTGPTLYKKATQHWPSPLLWRLRDRIG